MFSSVQHMQGLFSPFREDDPYPWTFLVCTMLNILRVPIHIISRVFHFLEGTWSHEKSYSYTLKEVQSKPRFLTAKNNYANPP